MMGGFGGPGPIGFPTNANFGQGPAVGAQQPTFAAGPGPRIESFQKDGFNILGKNPVK